MSKKLLSNNQYADYVSPVNADGTPVEFAGAPVGAHVHVATADLAAAQSYAKPAGATAMIAQNTGTAGLRFRMDGADPAAANGFQLRSSTDPILIPCPGADLRFIREKDGGVLDYQWVK